MDEDKAPTPTYAVCNDCDVELDTPEAAHEHAEATMVPVDEGGIRARSHRWTVINPTPEEQAEHTIGWIVSDALDRACDEIDRKLQRGAFTAEQVTKALRGCPDFSDAWENYLADNADEDLKP